jgi:hypothetical protein
MNPGNLYCLGRKTQKIKFSIIPGALLDDVLGNEDIKCSSFSHLLVSLCSRFDNGSASMHYSSAGGCRVIFLCCVCMLPDGPTRKKSSDCSDDILNSSAPKFEIKKGEKVTSENDMQMRPVVFLLFLCLRRKMCGIIRIPCAQSIDADPGHHLLEKNETPARMSLSDCHQRRDANYDSFSHFLGKEITSTYHLFCLCIFLLLRHIFLYLQTIK